MQTNNQFRVRIERAIAMTLLLVAAAISAQDLLHWARVAEERKLDIAERNYSAVRNMYAQQLHSNVPSLTRPVAPSAAN